MKKQQNYLNLLSDIGDLTDHLTWSSDINAFLQQAVELVADYFDADVCSIYLYEKITHELVLKATKGLNPKAVNSVRMKPGEGLVGYSFETLSVICEGEAKKNPKFKYFIEADEDPFNSFLSVPIKRGVEKIGVVVVQHKNIDYFDTVDVQAIKTAASQLAGSVENIQLLMELGHQNKNSQSLPHPQPLNFIKGESASSGYAFGPATILRKNRMLMADRAFSRGKKYTADDFARAVGRTSRQLKSLQEGFAERLPESASLIFSAHIMILNDKNFTGKMTELIKTGQSPMEAVRDVAGHYISLFLSSPHAYLREKALDVEDLAVRLLSNIERKETENVSGTGRIVIAGELYPSDILRLASGEASGIILVGGGIASHVAILSRSLQLPLILADEPDLLNIPEETPVLVDAVQGNIYINPSKDTLRLFEARHVTEKDAAFLGTNMLEKTETADGVRIRLLSNINLLSEVPLARALKAEGIGLYRTEFPFLIRTSFPSEAEQYSVYKKLFDSMADQIVTIRTLDTGGDKTLAYMNSAPEVNPELGLRSIRFSLKHLDVFESQIRAILRAAAGKENARIMFPLISSIDEFRAAKKTVMECMTSLDKEGIDHNVDISIGMMIELPSVLETIDEFAKEADFFSIGTNDFIQYMLAADRTNKLVADYYLPHHPAVIRGLSKIAGAASHAGIDAAVCGEMAHEATYIPFLLGIGIRTLSVDPKFLPELQAGIIRINMSDAVDHAQRMLSKTTVAAAAKELESKNI